MKIEQRISTHLWFDHNAEAAINCYCALFPNSRITSLLRYPKNSMGPEGSVMSAVFELDGQEFMAVNGGPHFRLSPAVSLFVKCDGQAEVDRLWDALLKDGGQAQQCGWLTDRFGLSWQIVPAELQRLLKDAGPEAYARIMEAVMQMVKLDLPTLQKAYRGD